MVVTAVSTLPQMCIRDRPWPSDEEERKQALSNFVFGVCGAQPNWNMENFIADQVELIRQQVGDRKVLLALSGGVDSLSLIHIWTN